MYWQGCYARPAHPGARLSFFDTLFVGPRNAREGEFVPVNFKPVSSMTPRQHRDQRQDLLTTTVRGIVQQEKSARDAKTAKLREARLARDAEAPVAPEVAPKRSRRKVTTDSGS